MFVKLLVVIHLFVNTLAISSLDFFLPKFQQSYSNEDVGDPLILTPLIESGQIEKAQQLSKVDGKIFKNVESYSGFLTVKPETNSNLHFWYFPSKNDPENSPLQLWLQGGPGSTSLWGLFNEHGPFKIKNLEELELRNTSWNKFNNLLYIDNPVNVGYSFSTPEGFVTNEDQVGEQLYNAVLQIHQLFPTLQGNEFYASGESYAGKYVPSLAYTIIKKNNLADIKINLQGILIGDGFVDPRNQLDYGDYLYQHGFIDERIKNQMNSLKDTTKFNIDSGNFKAAFENFNDLLGIFITNTGFQYYYNFLISNFDPYGNLYAFLQSSQVRKAIHVGNLTFHTGEDVHAHLELDFMNSTAPLLPTILRNCRVLCYNGQLDIVVAYPLTENVLKILDFDGADKYRLAKRKIWRVNSEIAGYVKSSGNLTEVMIRNAGHMAPFEQPDWCFDMAFKFTRHQPIA